MAYEIERKFLVRDESWREQARNPTLIRQAYLARTGAISFRVRIKDDARAALTIKSAATELRRLEFEYAIPLADAAALIELREGGLIEKLRYKLPQLGLTWEIDVFQSENEGLVIAEIELPHEDTVFGKPPWLGREITSDRKYSNASLAIMPFRKWPDPLGI
jgi:adenylate cyclase